MAEAEKTSGTANSGAAGDKGGQGNRKIAGKFDSLEEAVEKGYTGLETAYHETREEIGAIKQLLERAMTPIGSRGGRDDDYGNDENYRRGRQQRDRDDRDDDFDEAEFIASPKKILRRREEQLSRNLEDRVTRRNASMINNAAQVLRFQMQNPDLDEHENIVEGFYRKTDPNKSTYDRLKEAGKQTRQYIAKFKTGDDGDSGAGRSPEGDEYVEGAARGANDRAANRKGDAEDNTSSNAAKGVFNADDQLSQDIAEQRAWKSKRFAAPDRQR